MKEQKCRICGSACWSMARLCRTCWRKHYAGQRDMIGQTPEEIEATEAEQRANLPAWWDGDSRAERGSPESLTQRRMLRTTKRHCGRVMV